MIPFILAMLGDNPMQSEFASHIGLRGRMFCRACWVESIKQRGRQRKGKRDDSDSKISSDSGSKDDDDEQSEGCAEEDSTDEGAASDASGGGTTANAPLMSLYRRITALVKVRRSYALVYAMLIAFLACQTSGGTGDNHATSLVLDQGQAGGVSG